MEGVDLYTLSAQCIFSPSGSHSTFLIRRKGALRMVGVTGGTWGWTERVQGGNQCKSTEARE